MTLVMTHIYVNEMTVCSFVLRSVNQILVIFLLNIRNFYNEVFISLISIIIIITYNMVIIVSPRIKLHIPCKEKDIVLISSHSGAHIHR